MKEKDHSIFDAINRRDDALLQTILTHQGYPQGATRHGRTPLTQAACFGSAKAIQLLLDYGAPIDQMDKDEDWPLQVAIFSENDEATRCLLENGADIHLSNAAGLTSYAVAEDRFPQALDWLNAAQARHEAEQMNETTPKISNGHKPPRL
jgi:ankyrin repeat protein